jgi:hypothetical protein
MNCRELSIHWYIKTSSSTKERFAIFFQQLSEERRGLFLFPEFQCLAGYKEFNGKNAFHVSGNPESFGCSVMAPMLT